MTVWHFDSDSKFGRSEHEDVFFRELNSDSALLGSDLTNDGFVIESYDKIIYLDLNTIQEADAPFTMTLDISDLSSDIGSNPKAVNYLSFGYHIRGRSCTALTVGRAVNSDRFVLGTITDIGVLKSTEMSDYPEELEIIQNKVYRVTLVIDNSLDDENRIQLYAQMVNSDGSTGTPYLVASSENLELRNFSFVDRKLIVGSSAWTNEPEWEGVFDLANMKIQNSFHFLPNVSAPPIFYPGSRYHPHHHSMTNTSSAIRNNYRIATTGDVVHLQFHTMYRVQPERVTVVADGLSFALVSTDNTFVYDGDNTTLYTFQTTLTEEAPSLPLFGYTVDITNFYQKEFEFSVPMQLTNSDSSYTIYTAPSLVIVREPPAVGSFVYEIDGVGVDSVTLKLLELEDHFNTSVVGYQKGMGYTFTFKASLEELRDGETAAAELKETTISTMVIGDSVSIIGLQTDRFYNIKASITNILGQSLENVTPKAGGKFSSPIETIVDTVPPVIVLHGSPVTSMKDNVNKPGIRVQAESYDDTATDRRAFTFYVNAFESQQTDLSEEELFSKIKTNAVSEQSIHQSTATGVNNALLDIHNYTDADGVHQPIQVEKTYHIYMMSEDFADNRVKTISYSHVIDNTVSFVSAVFDNEFLTVGTIGHTVLLKWTSEYAVSADIYNVVIAGVTITPTTTDGTDWTATYPVTASSPAGLVTFEVFQNRDLSSTNGTSFSHTNTSTIIYIENRIPTISAVVAPNVTKFTLLNPTIEDFSIRSNQNPFTLNMDVYKTSAPYLSVENYNKHFLNYTEFQSTNFYLNDLDENQAYNIKYSLSNVFVENVDALLISNISTKIDNPIVVGSATETNESGEALITLDANSYARDPTSPFDMYAVVLQDDVSIANMPALLASLTPINAAPLAPDQAHLFSDFVSTFTTFRDPSGTMVPIVPSATSYKLYLIADDTHAIVPLSIDLNLDFTLGLEASISLAKTGGGSFVRDGDNISMTWTTPFKSVASDFSVSMMGAVASVVATDQDVGMVWKAESVFDASLQANEYKGGNYDFVLQYVGRTYTAATNALFVDLDAPEFEVEMLARNETSLHLGIRNILDVYTGTEHHFEAFVSVQAEGGTAIDSAVFTNTIANIQGYTFVVEGLTSNTFYSVTATVTDPAGNSTTTPAAVEGGTIKTRETIAPVITLPSDAFLHLDGESSVKVTGATALDVHSDFDVYVGIFQLVEEDPEISTEFLKSMVGTGAILKFANNPKNVEYTVDTTMTKFVGYGDYGWSTTVRPLAYNTTKRGVIAVVDADENEVMIKTTFQVNSAAVPSWLPIVEVEDDTGLLASTDASVAFMETPEGEIVGVDSSGSGNMFTVQLSSGASAATALSSNSVVNPVSLNMSVIESVVVPVSVEISESFSYGMWVNLQTDTPSEEPFSLLNSGDNQVIVVENNTITVSSGLVQVFTAPLPTNEWANIMVTSTGTEFKLFINSEEIKTKETTVNAPLVGVGSSLTIGTVPNLLIDDIRIYNEELSTEEVAVSIQSGSKQVHLTFEAGDLPEYTVSFDGDTLMLNGSLPNDTVTLFKGSKYTLYQNDNTNNNKPIHFVTSNGDNIVSADVEYFLDNNSFGNDAVDYINQFSTATFRKIVISPTGLGNTRIYFGASGSGSYTSFFRISMNSPYIVNTANIAATTTIATTNPSYTTDTPVGKLAVSFDASASQFISLEGETFQNMNMNTMTLGTWVNVASTGSDMPIISREDAFDMGVDTDGMIYMNIMSENTRTLFALDGVEFTSMQTIRLNNLRLTPTSGTRYYYVFASLDEIREKIKVIETALAHASNSALVYRNSTSSLRTMDILDLDTVLYSDEALSTKSVLSAYVYVVGLEKEGSHQLGDENHIQEFKVKRSEVDTLGNFAKISTPEEGRLFAMVEQLTISSVHPVASWIVFPLRPSETPSVTHRYTLTTVYDNGNVYNLSGLGNRPPLNINAGDELIFDVDLFVHPMIITDANGSAVANVENNDIFKGVMKWIPSFPGTYYYGCSSHSHSPSMGNTITVVDKLTNGSASKEAISLFAQHLMNTETLSEGLNSVNSTKHNVYFSSSSLVANQMHSITNLKFQSAFTLLDSSAAADMEAGANLMMCFVAVSNNAYHANTDFLNFMDLDQSMLLQLTERGFSNRYYEFSMDKHFLRLAHYDDTLSSWYRVQIDYLFDFSEIGAMYEYEYSPLWTSSDQYHALMFFDQRDAYVNYNTQHAHGFFAKGNMNMAKFENTEGWPTWHDGTTGNKSTSTSKWPRYQRITVIQAESTAWTGQVNNKTLNPANTYSDANELFFEFFSNPERTDLVASGTASQLRSYEHNDSHFHRSNQLYMSIMYNQVDPNGGGLEFGNLVRIR